MAQNAIMRLISSTKLTKILIKNKIYIPGLMFNRQFVHAMCRIARYAVGKWDNSTERKKVTQVWSSGFGSRLVVVGVLRQYPWQRRYDCRSGSLRRYCNNRPGIAVSPGVIEGLRPWDWSYPVLPGMTSLKDGDLQHSSALAQSPKEI